MNETYFVNALCALALFSAIMCLYIEDYITAFSIVVLTGAVWFTRPKETSNE